MKKYIKKSVHIVLFGMVLLLAFAMNANAQVSCPSGSECAWIDVVDTTKFGVTPSASSQHFWYDDQVTKNKLCQLSGYESNSGSKASIQTAKWNSCNAEYHVDWRGAWDAHKCGGDYYLTGLYCSRAVTPIPEPTVSISIDPPAVRILDSATITWSSQHATACSASGDWSGSKGLSGSEESSTFFFGSKTFVISCTGPGGTVTAQTSASVYVIPTAPTVVWKVAPPSVASGASYTVEAVGNDSDGDLVSVVIKKGQAVFATADGGDGQQSSASQQTSDTGPTSIMFTAQATDAGGRVSSEISHTVTVLNTTSGTGVNPGIPGPTIDPAPRTGSTTPITPTKTGPGVTLTPIVATVSVDRACVAPGEKVVVTGKAEGGILNGNQTIVSNILEKDSNKDGIYGVLVSRSDAGTQSVTVTVPAVETSNRYDFRTTVNGFVYSPVTSVVIDPSCGKPSAVCSLFSFLCSGPTIPTILPSSSASLSANTTCALPGSTVTFSSTVQGPVTSHGIEKDSNQDGVYGIFATLNPQSGMQTYSASFTEGVYDFRTAVNSSVYSSSQRVVVSSSCKQAVIPPVVPIIPMAPVCILQASPSVTSSGSRPPGISFKSINPQPQQGIQSSVSWYAPHSVKDSNGDNVDVSCDGPNDSSSGGFYINGAVSTMPSSGSSVSASCSAGSLGTSKLTVTFVCSSPSASPTPTVATCSDPTAANNGQAGVCLYPSFLLSTNLPNPPTVKARSFAGYSGIIEKDIQISVDPKSGFKAPITLTVDQASIPAGIRPEFSFDGGVSYSTNPSIMLAWDGARFYKTPTNLVYVQVRIRFNGQLGQKIYPITFTGTGGGKTSSVTVGVDSRPLYPGYAEI